MQIVRNRFVEALGSPDRGQRLVHMLALHGFGALQFVDVYMPLATCLLPQAGQKLIRRGSTLREVVTRSRGDRFRLP
jgi:hypothetical protein